MTARPFIGICLVTFVWIGVVGGLWAHEEYLLSHGREMTLQVLPVDPRDLLRGTYVALRYNISHFETSEGPMWDVRGGQTVYLLLKPDAEDWTIDKMSTEKPKEGLFLQGKVAELRNEKTRSSCDIKYGIESYFVPEHEAKRLESLREKKQLKAVVRVTPDGRVKIKRLMEGNA